MANGGLGAPIDYYGMIPDFRREALMETQNALGRQQIAQNDQAQQQQQRAQQQQALFAQDFQKAYTSNDPKEINALVAKYPGQMKTIQDGIGIKDEQQKIAVNNFANQLTMARQSGNPEAIARVLSTNAEVAQSIGVDPIEAMRTAIERPEEFDQLTSAVRFATMPIEKQYDIEDKQSQRDIQREGLDVQRRGQDITLRGQNISSQNAALDREIKRAEIEDKTLDRQIARETNLAKLEELKVKQQEARGKAEQARADKQATAQGAVDTFATALDSLNEITKSPGLSKAVGVKSAFPTVPGSDAANFETRLDTFKAQTFLPMVASLKGMGALSDAEGKKLSEAVGALNPRMSEPEFRRSADKIRQSLEGKLNTVKKQYNYQETEPSQTPAKTSPQPTAPQQGNTVAWGDLP